MQAMDHLGPAVLIVDLVGINGSQIRGEQLPVIIFAVLANTIEVSLN